MGTTIYDQHIIVLGPATGCSMSSSSQDVSKDNMHVMVCPQCKVHSVANGAKFKVDDLSIRIPCPSCGKRPISAHWHCYCGVVWHTCVRHSNHRYTSAPSQGRSRTRVRSTAKRQASVNADDLLDEDLLRESKLARKHSLSHCQLSRTSLPDGNIPYRMLPPRLRNKFSDSVVYEAQFASI